MLVLQRRIDETIIITLEDGRRIVLTLVDLRGDRARIGIAAPVTIGVHRGEVQERIDQDNAAMAAGG